MKMIVAVALALVAVASALPVQDSNPKIISILRSEFNKLPEGGYNFGYESEDGSSRSETGEVKEALDEDNKTHSVVVVRGSYSYLDENGQLNTVNYIADENGFRAEGDSIPKAVRR